MAAPFVFGRPGDPPGYELESRLYLSLAFVATGCVVGIVLDALRKDSEKIPLTRDHQHNPIPNVNAHRIVQESTRDDSETPTDLDGTW